LICGKEPARVWRLNPALELDAGVKTIDRKLHTIADGRGTPDVLISSDAKDTDMPFGAASVVEHDPPMVVGVFGGCARTARRTIEVPRWAERFGDKIKAERQLDLVGLMRRVLRGELTPVEAVRAYREALTLSGLPAQSHLVTDLEVTEPLPAQA
jgi:hypothetical protein